MYTRKYDVHVPGTCTTLEGTCSIFLVHVLRTTVVVLVLVQYMWTHVPGYWYCTDTGTGVLVLVRVHVVHFQR